MVGMILLYIDIKLFIGNSRFHVQQALSKLHFVAPELGPTTNPIKPKL